MTLLCRVAAILLLGVALPALAITAPEPFDARYSVLVDGFQVGVMSQRLNRESADTYHIEVEMETTGLIALFRPDRLTQRGVVRINGDGITPLEFVSEHVGRNRRSVEQVYFDWENGTATSRFKGQEAELPLEPGVFDKLSYQIALREDVIAGREELDYRIADRDRVRDYDFRIVGEETLETALGALHTIRIEKEDAVMWLAPELGHVLVKLVRQDNGHTLVSAILSVE